MTELRFHPFLNQWVVVSTHRQNRTYFPAQADCPLCPGPNSEIPFPHYEIAVFENKFPAFERGNGVCEVVAYSPDHETCIAQLPVDQIANLIEVWRHRTQALSARPDVAYVFIFENRGAAVGVTLTHPHGQIYGYPFVPPNIQVEHAQEMKHFESTGRALMDDWLAEEIATKTRVIAENDAFCAVVPAFGRFPYETWVVTKCNRQTLMDLTPSEVQDLAQILKALTQKFDRLFEMPASYMMAIHQFAAPHSRLHFEFLLMNRSADKLKFLAASESSMGTFITDLCAEECAEHLRLV